MTTCIEIAFVCMYAWCVIAIGYPAWLALSLHDSFEVGVVSATDLEFHEAIKNVCTFGLLPAVS